MGAQDDNLTLEEIYAQNLKLAGRFDTIEKSMESHVQRTMDLRLHDERAVSEMSVQSLTLANRLDGIELAIDQHSKRNNALEELLQLANSQTDKLEVTLSEMQHITSALQLEVAAKRDDRERIANSVASVHGQLQQAMDLFSGGQAQVDSVLTDCDNLRQSMETLRKVQSEIVRAANVEGQSDPRRRSAASSIGCFSCLDSK